jgi:UDP-4-amino-4,6-dideoxy-N-acetyl-beta-L-altrosamine N-acetyltransferase
MHRDQFNLRPIEEGDLDLVLSWRNSERVRECMYTDHIITPGEHRAWFERARLAEFPAVLIFEHQGRAAGLKSFAQIDRQNSRCHWGFYLGERELPRGCATVMGFLALEYIFESHHFHKLCAEAFAGNESSARYHARLGFRQEGRYVQHVLKNGMYQDVLSFGLLREEWLAGRRALETRVFPKDGAR